MGEYKILPTIKSPNDVKKLSEESLKTLCTEIREKLVEVVSVNGGHLSPNLGVVELTVALHRSFNFPKDSIVWDVGHQSYTHKLLTGRYKDFDTLRLRGGISGFPKREESRYDDFNTGHSSTSISAAFGIANAKMLSGDNSQTIAVIGDGSFTGGLAFEAMNNAGRFNRNFIVVLNDNKMSISKNVGAFPRYLTTVRIQPWYIRVKHITEKTLSKLPVLGRVIKWFLKRSKSKIKNLVYKNTLFDCFGFTYLGPIDGHSIDELENAFEVAKKINSPVLLHVVTKKGKGYLPAEEKPGQFHGIGQFDIDSGEPISSHTGFSAVFGSLMCELAQQDSKICAITAAMAYGTGLREFSHLYKDRFFDVGIAEEHAVTFGCGLASKGMRPVFAVYSTFLQRAYDQLIHDAALGKLHLVLAIDRAGIVGSDGETHQGVFDVSILNTIPNATIYSPTYFDGLRKSLHHAVYACDELAAVRYPRGGELYKPDDFGEESIDFNTYGNPECGNLIVTYGRLFSYAAKAKEMLKEQGVEVCLLKLCRLKPIDVEAVEFAAQFKNVWFFEEGIKNGGIARNFSDMLFYKNFKGSYHIKAINDKFVKQMSVSEALEMLKLDSKGMVEVITTNLRNEE
ncbi:1-deoxy-D-xylulose-5-phosphate synthase [Ruminococcus sp. YE282]|uniref:1-deoxy-D-xylulose-5-phosphate synthase n=1 Tax=Ruminococcus sp. YE282 TaxID=3158780 RepID=UPI00088E7FCD|nr:1-deoxy-D-xylulose-5-phosphate synthase [Ruminococcus bromii]